MRLFIAIDAGAVEKQLIEIQLLLPKDSLKLSFTKSFHCTLAFLGEVDFSGTEKIKRALTSVSFLPFTATLGKLGCFPSMEAPRVIWAGLEPASSLEGLQQKVEGSLQAAIIPKQILSTDKVPFIPHLTLARVRSVLDSARALKSLNSISISPIPFTVGSFHLFSSTLAETGPEYKIIASYPAK
ncbi:RNA 2',3'-cyclic phosphodiesterase [Candidatus Woesearchaeota archaeon]|nr:RNA 2',3'-cyclic phosphodiesterase [Candidatus Woesearchaeota archaeon]